MCDTLSLHDALPIYNWLAAAWVMLVAIAAVILAGITGMIGLVMFY
jgi:hypothetical protein